MQLRVHLVQVLRFLYGLGDHDQLLDQGGGRKVFLFNISGFGNFKQGSWFLGVLALVAPQLGSREAAPTPRPQ